MASPFEDKEYIKCKLLVKRWEHDFKKREKRMPTKKDYSETAPSKVKEAYKLYWTLKTSFLEEHILDDEIENKAQEPTPIIENEKKNESSPPPESNSVNSKSVWGEHLNKPPPKEDKAKTKRPSLFQFNEKLFKGSNFKKRNPRKSFVANRSKPSDSLPQNEESQDSLPQNEESQDLPASSESNQTPQLEDESPIVLNENIKITTGPSAVIAQPVNILQKIDNLKDIQTKTKLNTGWLERCNQTCDLSSVDMNSINIPAADSNQDSDEDYVLGSDDENSQNTNFPPKMIFARGFETGINSNLTREASIAEKLPAACNRDPESEPNRDQPSTSSNPMKSSQEQPQQKHSPLEDSHPGPSKPIELCTSVPNSIKRVAAKELPRPNKKPKTSVEDFDEIRKTKALQEKVASGKANENFISLNMKKKIYVRGKKTMTGAKYKKQQWKMKKKFASGNSTSGGDVGGVLKCFKCGDVGHFSRQCKNKNYLLPKEEDDEEEDCPFPTLEEAAEMIKESNEKKNKNQTIDEANDEILEELANLEEPSEEPFEGVRPLYQQIEDCIQDTPEEVFEALHDFGYQYFRPGQEEAISRILYGKSTLFISSTGSGKSLCYQIPAYLYAKKYKCISLVISPLVSLMEDQVINFPKILPAACLHTNQTEVQRNQILERIKQNEIAVLLVSPEAMVSNNSPLNRAMVKDFPPIAFACIDEVHCVSQWSHNFRTSYLMICKILKERFNVNTLLGLTATATKSTLSCIKDHLGINEEEGIIQDKILPDNLILSVSRDENRDQALVKLLETKPFCEHRSIIIYCIRRNECERLAALLRTVLKDTRTMEINVKTRKTLSPDVEEYHAGLSAARRKRVQNAFMSGKIRIVVATVAFGMGINKSDIRGIIHYNMPKTYEHYVQEIGRAGRDGLPAHCHLFLDSEGNDLPELKRQIFANSVDRHIIRKLLQNVFISCNCGIECKRHEVAFSVEKTVRALDLNQENITTLLCYLELLPEKFVQVLPPAYTFCTIESYGGIRALKNAAKKCAPLAYAIAEHCRDSNDEITSKLEFSVIELANKISWKSGTVKNELKQCEWTRVNDKPKKTGLKVNFHDLGFHVSSIGNLTPEQIDDVLDTLFSTVQSQEKKALYQLQTCFETFHLYSFGTVEKTLQNEDLLERSNNLKNAIRSYFSEESDATIPELPHSSAVSSEVTIACDVHRIVSSYRDCTFTGRSIAKIFHGIESPNFPATMWSRSPFWRCGLREDFNILCRVANRELIKLR